MAAPLRLESAPLRLLGATDAETSAVKPWTRIEVLSLLGVLVSGAALVVYAVKAS